MCRGQTVQVLVAPHGAQETANQEAQNQEEAQDHRPQTSQGRAQTAAHLAVRDVVSDPPPRSLPTKQLMAPPLGLLTLRAPTPFVAHWAVNR